MEKMGSFYFCGKNHIKMSLIRSWKWVNKCFVTCVPPKSNILSVIVLFLSFFTIWYFIKGKLMQKERNSLLYGLWSFMLFDSSTQMEMLQKIIDWESLENFPKKVCDEACFNKIGILCCTNCKCAIISIHQRFFSGNSPKIYILGSTREFSPSGLWKIALYKTSEKFLRDMIFIFYLTKLQASNL